MLRPTLAAYLLVLVWGGGDWADAQELRRIHPSKIPPQQFENVKFCTACHKSVQGKFTHSAIQAAGCVSCHELKSENDQTMTSLVERGNALCLTCHSDKEAKQAQVRVHGPVAEGECVACHSPHASGNQFQLLQPASGGKDENLCLTCHDTGESIPEKGSRHPALDLGCDNCHVTHKSGTPGTPEYFHLTQPVPALCLTCHDARDKSLTDAHRGQPFAEANCLSCHNPHASANPKLTHQYVHFPFGERQCDACHEAPKEGKVQLTDGGKHALCFTCHDNIQTQINNSKHKHSVFEVSDTCTVCHSPHTTPNPKQLVAPVVSLCETCHTDRAEEQTKMKFLHRPVFEAGCTVCHQPHAAESPANLRARVEDLCLRCHGRDAAGEPGSDATTLVMFGGSVRLPGDYLEKVKRIPLARGADTGHPLGNHPVTGRPDPSDPGKTLSCVSCHTPHASNGSPKFFVTGTKASSPLCLRCHK